MRRFYLFLLLLAISIGAYSQKTTVYTFIEKDKVNIADSISLYKTLLANTPREPEFMYEPHFAIVGNDGKFFFSTGARLRFTASFDWENPIKNPSGMGIENLTHTIKGNENLFQMSAGTSSLYFNVIGFPNTENQVGLFISLTLDADDNNTYMVKAGQIYMRYRDFLCGYATSLYSDREADAYYIDKNGPCASGTQKRVQINFQHYFIPQLKVGLGVELPKVNYTQPIEEWMSPEDIATLQYYTYQRVPDIPAYVGYYGKYGHLRLSAVVRNIFYYDYYQLETKHSLGYGLKLTGHADIGPVSLYGMLHGGRSIASFMAGNSSSGLDLVPSGEYDNSSLCPTHSWGFIAATQVNFTKNLFMTASFAYLRNYTNRYLRHATTEYEDLLRSGLTASGNLVWRISDLFSTGIEFNHIHRTNEDNYLLKNNRVYAMFMMTF
ncbi:MAG: hypothetical protein HUJ90_02100 [Bacteroidales bacterium]|nr:hypothetical protein [Bacteroidales bacterium]